MLNIRIETIPHEKQQYETVGNWFWDVDTLVIHVSNMKNWKYELLVAIHEITETALCRDRNISEDSVTDFDLEFEARRQEGNTDEPGDDPNSPYRKEHLFATNIERLLAAELKVEWDKYEKTINSL
jgi:hypothetical protein